MQESNNIDQLRTQQTEQESHQLQNQFGFEGHFHSFEHQNAISVMCKIIKRNYSRHFIKSLTFAYIQALRKQHRKQQQIGYQTAKSIIDWPFRSLLFKKSRNQNQQQMLQFVHHCATLIQANFKAYIARKRHLVAISKAKRTKDLLQSFMARWKVYRIYNCEKIVLIRNKIKQIQRQIEQQQQNFTTRDAKKLKFLYKCYESNNKSFKNQFDVLMEDGAWILQKNMKPIHKNEISRQRNNKSIQITNKNNKSLPKLAKIQYKIQDKKQNININHSPQINSKFQNKSTTFSQFEDRPIKAAGQYKYNENEQFTQSTSANLNNYDDANLSQNTTSNNENQLKKKQRLKKQNQLQKRKKYDPRKAIQQQKKKKKQIQKQQNLQKKTEPQNKESDIKLKQENVKSKKIVVKTKLQDKKEKKNQAIQNQQAKNKESKLKKQIKVDSKNSKHPLIKKISSKVDCWVGKKQQQPEWVKQYKLRMLEQNKKQNEEQQIKKENSQIDNSTKIQQKKMQIIQQREKVNTDMSQQIEKAQTEKDSRRKNKIAEAWQSNQRQFEKLREKHIQNVNKRKNSMQNSQSMARLRLERQYAPRKKQLHRSIQQLQQTYNKQYLNRLQNLMPRLNLLSVSRRQEQNGKIPVIDEQNQQFNIWFQQLSSSNQFWKKFNEHQKVYESFIFS